ncbi:hypothetical protein BCR35DRAFT_306468 [Leucosporidium creatinivorum]|uniref:C3H1-type domain-containing protein n=1 Tax=Leucosporidium creatinivorum TaxID=106004 RepID=A0A1Y2ETZ7_9BASI|nr:hypothetical protein BCR35DRAFT_306468 [Leucosporidium creatinivorum]
MADIVPSSPQGQALQNAIQDKLVSLGWTTEATEDDPPVMAEYILVMLGNRKTAEQINDELSSVTTDYDPSFVTWLFQELERHYPSTNPSTTTAPAPSSAPPTDNRRPNAPPPSGRNIFGAAMSGVKRDSRDLEAGGREPPAQRARFENGGRGGYEGVPNGPRGGAQGPQGGRRQPNGLPQPPQGGGDGNLLNRMGPAPTGNRGGGGNQGGNTMGMPRAAYEAISQTIAAVNAGAHPSALAAIPFPALAAHPSSKFLPPQILAQAQAHAMAQAQAFAAMQGVWGNAPGAPGPPGGGFNPQAPAFNPSFGGGPRGGPGGAGGHFNPSHPANSHASKPTPPPPAPKSVVLPTKPEQEQICKHATECSKPPCPYSHPSPVATKESGLVLSSEACELQLECKDPDCPKSHISPSQKSMTSGSVKTTPAGTLYTAPPSTTASRPTPAADPNAIPGAGEKPCKFAGSCTRKGCVFLHPWDKRGDPATQGQGVPCHWGAACTRADCHFTHPPNRPSPYSKSFTNGSAHLSKTFNKPSTTSSSSAGIGAWPKEAATHVSDRLKRFNVKEGEEGGEGAERIIPGGAGKEDKGDDKAKVEIVVEDEEEKKPEAAAAKVEA